jgi:hypothetical protein
LEFTFLVFGEGHDKYQALHPTAIPLHFIAAGEPGRYTQFKKYFSKKNKE